MDRTLTGRRLREAGEILALTCAAAIAVKTLAVDAVHIPSASMENTLLAGDFVVVNKFAYGPSTPRYVPLAGSALPVLRLPGPGLPRRGDVVVFYAPAETPPRLYIKRVAAVPGDTVLVRRGVVLVNGREMTPPASAKSGPAADFGPVIVPASGREPAYFVLGDNLGDSSDSRAWGLVPLERIIGKALCVYWSLDDEGRVRWSRLGTLVR